MKTVTCFSAILLLFSFVSCNEMGHNVTENSSKFKIEKSLKAEVVKVPDVLYNVTQMQSLNDYLITLDFKADTIFQIFKLPNLSYSGAFHTRGMGPNESKKIDPGTLRRYSFDKFYFIADGKIKFVEISRGNIFSNIEESIDLPTNSYFMNQVFILNDSSICGYDNYQSHKLEFLCINQIVEKEINEFGAELPYFVKNVKDDRLKAQGASKMVAIKPDKSFFAVLYDKAQHLRIYSKNGSLVKDIRFIDAPLPSMDFLNGKISKDVYNRTIVHYIKIQATDNYIYGMYIGKPMAELPQNGLASLPCEFHVFDWHGNNIAKFNVSEYLFSFAVTQDDKYIIASSLEEINKLLKYEIQLTK